MQEISAPRRAHGLSVIAAFYRIGLGNDEGLIGQIHTRLRDKERQATPMGRLSVREVGRAEDVCKQGIDHLDLGQISLRWN